MQEKPEGKVAELWQSKFTSSGLATADAATGLAHVFAQKDKDEVQLLRRSAFLSASVMRDYAVPQLESMSYPSDTYLPDTHTTQLAQPNPMPHPLLSLSLLKQDSE